MAFLNSSEEDIYDFIKRYCKNFFDKNNFEFFKKDVGDGMGAEVIFSNSNILLKIVNDRDGIELMISNIEERKFWRLDFIMAYFKITDYKIEVEDTISRKRVLLDTFKLDDYSGMMIFLSKNVARVKDVFSPIKYIEVKKQLEALDIERGEFVKQMLRPKT